MPRQYTPRVDVTCSRCGKTFTRRPCEVHDRVYCSRTCRYAPSPQAIEIMGDGSARIALTGRDGDIRGYALFDGADVNLIRRWHWNFDNGYATRTVWPGQKGASFKVPMHREISGLRRGDPREPDHINRNKLDNRRSNLRVIPKRRQAQNLGSRRGSSSAYRGVTWSKGQRQWRARIRVDGKLIHLGYFPDERLAGDAARAARLRMLPYAVD